MDERRERAFARKGRTAGLVIAGAGLMAIFAPGITGALRLPGRYEILIYLFSLAAFVWAMVVVWQMWQMRQEDRK
ncbi:MAG: DUF5337 domain-containing protein [Pseudomonadota bacterium]